MPCISRRAWRAGTPGSCGWCPRRIRRVLCGSAVAAKRHEPVLMCSSSEGEGIDYTHRLDRLPSATHSATGDLFLRDAAGKGLNQADAAARLGARTALIATVGQDHGWE